MTFSSRLARVRITGSSFVTFPAGPIETGGAAGGGTFLVWPEAIPINPIAQTQALNRRMFISLLNASIRRDIVVRSVEHRCRLLRRSSSIHVHESAGRRRHRRP